MELFEKVRQLVAQHSNKEIGFKAIKGPGTTPLIESCFDTGDGEEEPTTYQAMVGDTMLPYTFEHDPKTLRALGAQGMDPLEAIAPAIAESILKLIEPKKYMKPEEPVFGFTDILEKLKGTHVAAAISTRLLSLREVLMALYSEMTMEAFILSHDLTGDFMEHLEKKDLAKDASEYTVESMRYYILERAFKILEEAPCIDFPHHPDEETEKYELFSILQTFSSAMQAKLFAKTDEGWKGWDDGAFYDGTGDYEKTFCQRLSLTYSKLLDELPGAQLDRAKLRHLFVELANYCLFGYFHNQF